jgi:uncharacterized protein (UPF0276 family)
MSAPRLGLPDLGIGVGLRVPHYRRIFAERPHIDFVELISENFMVAGGRPRYHLERALECYPVVAHGVSLGIGGPDEPDASYLRALRAFADRADAPWVSDHFCWCGSGGAHLHDLLPLPFTRELVSRVADRAKRVQDELGRPLALENTSTYLTFKSSVLPEWEFIGEIAERADIGLLFDVNNVFVTAYNHGLDPVEFVRRVPAERIVQIHLAGHTNLGTHIIDTHRGHVIDPVWDLYRLTIERTGAVSTLIEWDDEIPELEVLLAEAERARTERELSLRARAAGQSSVDAAAIERIRDAARAKPQESSDIPRAWVQGGPREAAE